MTAQQQQLLQDQQGAQRGDHKVKRERTPTAYTPQGSAAYSPRTLAALGGSVSGVHERKHRHPPSAPQAVPGKGAVDSACSDGEDGCGGGGSVVGDAAQFKAIHGRSPLCDEGRQVMGTGNCCVCETAD